MKNRTIFTTLFGCSRIAFCILFCQTTLCDGHEWMAHSTDSIFTFGLLFKIYLPKCVRVRFHGLNNRCIDFLNEGNAIVHCKWNALHLKRNFNLTIAFNKPGILIADWSQTIFTNEYYLFQWILYNLNVNALNIIIEKCACVSN